MKSPNKTVCTILIVMMTCSTAAEEFNMYDADGNVVETLGSDQRSEYSTYDRDGERIDTRNAEGEPVENQAEPKP